MSIDKFSILGNKIKKGESAFLEMEIAKLHTRNSIHIPIIVERSKNDGPVVLLMAGLHGDEINGVAIVRDIIQRKYNKPKCGTIICIPVFNVFGYLIQSREFPDGRDLNRMFPGSSTGSLAGQFAFQFMKEIAPLVDYVIDYHTGGADRANIPQIRCVLSESKTVELAKIFDPPIILHSNYINKTVREAINKMGKTILLFEGGKSKEIDDYIVKSGVSGTLNVLKHLGMQDGKPTNPTKTVIVSKSKWLRAPFSGMFQLKVINGSKVSKKDVLGVIRDPYGEFERKILAPFDCYILCANTTPIVNKGDALFHVSLEVV